MKRLTLAIVVIALSGCSTVHDYCVSHADHYSDYDECYQEVSARRERVREAWNNIWSRPTQQVTCNSYDNGFGTVQTTCR